MARGGGTAAWELEWKGRELAIKMQAAEKIGVDQTMARCVTMAKSLVRVRTAALQGSLRFEPSRTQGNGVVGVWGSFDINYAIFQELGTWKMRAKPYLRPSADFEYGLLGSRIQRAFHAL